MAGHILVKFPSRSRPDQFLRVLKGWASRMHAPSRVTWLFSFDEDDRSMRDIRRHIEPILGLQFGIYYGHSASKIHAINRDIDQVTMPWDILLVLSDDMVCQVDDWDTVIRNAFAEDLDKMVWLFDGKQKDICTLPLMGKPYYDRFGYVYNPVYTSVFADDEATAVARMLGKLVYSPLVLAEHRHPANVSTVKPDALYRKNETHAIWAKDEAIYKQRKTAGFP